MVYLNQVYFCLVLYQKEMWFAETMDRFWTSPVWIANIFAEASSRLRELSNRHPIKTSYLHIPSFFWDTQNSQIKTDLYARRNGKVDIHLNGRGAAVYATAVAKHLSTLPNNCWSANVPAVPTQQWFPFFLPIYVFLFNNCKYRCIWALCL